MIELETNYEDLYKNIVRRTIQYLEGNPNVRSMVVGISGGIDSALIAALCEPVCSTMNIPLIGRSITIETNKRCEIDRAYEIGNVFCDNFLELDLTHTYRKLVEGLDMISDIPVDQTGVKIAEGNIKARLRMIQLYHLAGVNKGMVLSTDNLTELYLGFWTLHGDVGDFGMIQGLWKTEVYGLSNWLVGKYREDGDYAKSEALLDCINAVPTDGLGISNSDLDQLGVGSYAEVDQILIQYLNLGEGEVMTPSPVIDRYERTHFKRNNPYNIPRQEILP